MSALYPDWIEANRRGELADDQRRNFRAWANSDRRGALSLAAVFLVIAVLVGVFASAAAPPVTRAVITAVALLLAVVIGLRAIIGLDAFTRDVRAGGVQSVEGAIGKRGSVVQRHDPQRTKVLQVGDQRFHVGPSIYEKVPDAGFVRYYYLPRSRKFVNVERLERELAPELQTRDAILARADAAVDRLSVGFADPRLRNPEPHDAGSLAGKIVGTWSNPTMSVTFRNDGTVSARVMGMAREGKWSIGADGRLSSDITGEQEVADASVHGDQLTISHGGQGFKFKRN